MVRKDKMFIVSETIDDSIKSQVSIYDITIFKSFIDLQSYVNKVPVKVTNIVITSNELPFTNANLQMLISLIKAPFLTLDGKVLYLIDKSYNVDIVKSFLSRIELDSIAVYQNDLSTRFMLDIISGEGRDTIESQNYMVTYRIRADEYIKFKNRVKYDDVDNKYQTDEDDLSGIPDIDEPEDMNASRAPLGKIEYIVGMNSQERTLMAFLVAQYYALSGKTLMIDKDSEYHRLLDMVLKSGIECCIVKIEDIQRDIRKAITRIRTAPERLIIIAAKRRIKYNYSFLFDLLYNNLNMDIPYFVRECNIEEAPYGQRYTMVIKNTVPDLLEALGCLKIKVRKDTMFIGLQIGNMGPMNIVSKEMEAIIYQVLLCSDLVVQVLHAEGLTLQSGGVISDIFSYITADNR